MLQVTLQDAQRETAVLARRLGLAARENEELAMSATETQQPSLAGKVGQDGRYLGMTTICPGCLRSGGPRQAQVHPGRAEGHSAGEEQLESRSPACL